MARPRRRTVLVVSCLALGLTAILWPLSNTRGRSGMGLAVGIRNAPSFSQRPGFHLIWGIVESNSGTEVWYYNGSIPFVGELDMVRGREGVGLLGVRLIAYAPNAADWYFGVGLPFWLIAILGVIGVRRSRWRAPPPVGVCARCGYDLRATPERCPECGAVPAGANGNAEAQRR